MIVAQKGSLVALGKSWAWRMSNADCGLGGELIEIGKQVSLQGQLDTLVAAKSFASWLGP